MSSSVPQTPELSPVAAACDSDAGPERPFTVLPTVLSDVEWKDGFAVGVGVNVVTGEVAGHAFDVTGGYHAAAMVDEQDATAIGDRKTSSYEKAISIMMSCENFNLAPLNFHAGGLATISSSIQASESTLTYLVYYTSLSAKLNVDNRHFILSDAARTCALTNPSRFREIYGDYFVAGPKMGRLFIAVVALKSLQHAERKKLAAELHVGLPKGFSARDAIQADRFVSQTRAEYSIKVWQSGLSPTAYKAAGAPALHKLQSFEEVSNALDWFRSQAQGVEHVANLHHYSLLPGLENLPSRLPMDPQVFVEIHELRALLFTCTMLVNSLPAPYGTGALASHRQELNRVSLALRNEQSSLPQSPALREGSRQALLRLEATLNEIHDVYAVFQTVLQHRADEPKPRQDEPRQRWSFGLTPEHSTRFVTVLPGPSETIRSPGRRLPLTKDDVQATIKPADQEHIVGWQITPEVGRTGSWRKVSASVILAREATVTCRAEVLDKCSWTFSTFVVANNEYFTLFYKGAEKSSETTLISDDAVKHSVIEFA